MRISAKIGGILTVLSFTVVGTVQGQDVQERTQDHVITDQELRSAVRADVEAEAADRALLERVLSRPEVQTVAEDAGLEVERARDAVEMLEGRALARAASAATDVEEQLAGGQSTVTIGTTTIIIVLLVLILIAVA